MPYQPTLIFVGKARSLPKSGAPSRCFTFFWYPGSDSQILVPSFYCIVPILPLNLYSSFLLLVRIFQFPVSAFWFPVSGFSSKFLIFGFQFLDFSSHFLVRQSLFKLLLLVCGLQFPNFAFWFPVSSF
jgi:hypothetical protein